MWVAIAFFVGGFGGALGGLLVADEDEGARPVTLTLTAVTLAVVWPIMLFQDAVNAARARRTR